MLDHKCQHYLVFSWWMMEYVMSPHDGIVDFILPEKVNFWLSKLSPMQTGDSSSAYQSMAGNGLLYPSGRAQLIVCHQSVDSTALLSQAFGTIYGTNLYSGTCFQLF